MILPQSSQHLKCIQLPPSHLESPCSLFLFWSGAWTLTCTRRYYFTHRCFLLSPLLLIRPQFLWQSIALIGTLLTPAQNSTGSCFQSCARGYHDEPKTTGLHVNEWLKPNFDCCLLSCRNWSTVGGHPTSLDCLELLGNPSLTRSHPGGCWVEISLHRTSEIFTKTSHFPPVFRWFRERITLRCKIIARWEGERYSYVQVKSLPLAVIHCWNFLM